MQTTSTILMIRPVNFGFNEQTAESNAFQDRTAIQQDVQEKALKEFDVFVEKLRSKDIEVIVVEDTITPHTPDSIFPNNWISTHTDGKVFLYPMQAENRRLERREDLIETLKKQFKLTGINDLSYFEQENKFLEGTGSLVLDHDHRIAYSCLSSRTNTEVLAKFCEQTGYKAVTFHAVDENGKAIYHTNVMMCVADHFVVICLDTIKDDLEKNNVVESLVATGKEIVQISMEQMNQFAGNMLQLINKKGELFLIMSERAYKSLSKPQINQIEAFSQIIYSNLETIENNGGGSARCMIAEIYLPKKND